MSMFAGHAANIDERFEMPERLIYPDAEARALLGGIGRTTQHELVVNGDLEKVKIGRRAFITAASIDAYLAKIRGVSA